MKHALVIHNVLSMRANPAPGAEIVSQAVFGDPCDVLDTSDAFARIRTEDGYEGWVERCHISDAPEGVTRSSYRIADAFAAVVNSPDEYRVITKLSMGSRVQVVWQGDHHSEIALLHGSGYIRTSALYEPDFEQYGIWSGVLNCINQLVGTPYLWGGTTAFGIDCSGFVQRVFSMCGILLPRDAYLQAASKLGESLSPDAPHLCMDIVFFRGREDPRKRGITHVGIALDPDRFYHASRRFGVTLSRFDDPEICHEYTCVGGLRIA